MTRVYLLNPPFIPHFGRGMRWQDTGRSGTLYYPIWLSYATGVLEQAGFETRLVDAPAWGWDEERVVQDAKAFEPALIVVDSGFTSLSNDVRVAQRMKESVPDALVAFVGPPASQFPDRILENEGIDIVARWEYDFTLREIAEGLERKADLGSVAGVSYRDGGAAVHNPDRDLTVSADLDGMPFVSTVYAKHLHVEDYFLGNSLYPEVQLFTGRGCPFQCTFCSWPQTLMGRKYRTRSISSVLDEMEWVQENLPQVKEIFLEDDTFTIDKGRVLSFTEEYLRRGLGIVWACNARADLDYDTMKRMKEANCRLLIVGYESGNDAILKSIKKGVTVDDIRRFARDAKRAGLLVLGDFIIGLPGETRETIKCTRGLIEEVRPELLQVSVASPFPGTEFYEWARANGYLITDDPNEYLDEQGHQKSIVAYPWLPAEEIVATVDEILKHYYLSPAYVPLVLRQVFRRHGRDEAQRILINARGFMRYVRSR